jgi:TrmH family RNA methyltransferase
VLARVATTVTPQPVLAVAPRVETPLDSLRSGSLIVVCVDVRDPGNAGTVLRSAEAAGASGVVSCGTSVDFSNPKCVRASAGALFHVPVVAGGEAVTVLEKIGAWPMQRLGAVVGAGTHYTEADLRRPTALVLGNEAHGLPADVIPMLDGLVHIPMAGRTESLNVGMACAVLCFEAARQRRGGEEG